MQVRMNRATLSAGLLGMVLIALGLLYWQQARLQAVVADNRLDAIRSAQTLVEQQIAKDVDSRAQLIAGNQAFVGYVTQAMGGILPGTVVDTASIVDLLEERRAQLGLTIAAVINGQGQLIASRDGISERRSFTSEPLFVEAVSSISATHGLWVDDGRVFYVTILPLAAYGSDAGFLLAGMPLDQSTAKAIAGASGAEVSFFANTQKGPLMAASTLDATREPELLPNVQTDLGTAEHRFSTRLGGQGYRGLVSPLFGSDSVQLLALVSNSAGLASSVALGLPMIVGIVLCLSLLVVAAIVARSMMVKQVHELTLLMDHAANTGDFHLKSSEANAGLLAPLIVAFNHLMARLDPGKRN